MENPATHTVAGPRRCWPTFAITYLLIGVIAAVVLGSMLWIYNTGHLMASRHEALSDAAVQIEDEATLGHLWIEEAIGGDKTVDINDVLAHIDKARWYANAMLDGSDDKSIPIPPLIKKERRQSIEEVLTKLNRFRAITLERWASRATAGAGSELDQQYDAVFKDFIEETDNVSKELDDAIVADLRNFSEVQIGLMILAFATMLAVASFFSYFLYHRIQDENELLAANQHLDASNQQLRAMQQQMESSNQQLEASAQQLRAANQQLTANEQQLRAANQQLLANEQQLRAANLQLSASEQQLLAANQQLAAANQMLRSHREQLTEQNNFLTDVFESLQHPLYVINPDDYSIEMANSASGFDENTEGWTCFKLTHNADCPCSEKGLECPLEYVRKNRRPISVEHVHVDADGNSHYMEIHAYPVLDGEGNVVRIIESTQDITERKQAEKQIKSLAKFPSENPHPVMRVSNSGRIMFANKAAGALLEAWLCKDGDQLPDRWTQQVADTFSHGRITQAETQCGSRWFLLSFAPVNEFDYVNIYGLDITKRVQAQHEIEQLAKFPSENPNPVMRVASDSTVLYANQASKDLLTHWGCDVGSRLPAVWTPTISESLSTGRAKVSEIEVGHRSLSLQLAPIPEHGYVNVYGLDTTDRVRAEQQVRQAMIDLEHTSRLITVGEMASGIAHELNQPLCAILNYANTCIRSIAGITDKPPRLSEALEQVAFQANRAAEIIRRLRSLVAKREVSRTSISINEIVEDVLLLQKSEANQKGVTIKTELAEKVPLVQADTVQIEQVLLNFLRNAFDAVCEQSQGRPTVIVRTTVTDKQVEVSVIDNGKGLAEGEVQKVFDSFYTTKPNGLGIGLSLSRSIIEAHNGTIKARSTEEGGAAFEFTLPVTG